MQRQLVQKDRLVQQVKLRNSPLKGEILQIFAIKSWLRVGSGVGVRGGVLGGTCGNISI